ncbi:hypothetical protein CJF32_00001076 [Rutstroemia sp. NJR-2017a WRK4]|nr:hypothetical protein CJF32_00001076 [Rutstroemia sp. NJR-2017a WRK4]
MSSRPELKVDDEGGFIKFFKNLPQNDNDTVRVFDRGDWYTAHGDDASFIARTVYKTTSVLRQLGRNDSTGLPSVTMSITVFRNFLREALFKLGKRVEVWENTGRMNWKITKQASPGNLQDIEEELGGSLDAAPIILAVKVSAKAEARNVGVCFADASTRELGISEFLDNDLYSNFESLLIQLGVKECLVQVDKTTKDVELTKLKAIMDSCGCAVSERPGGDFAIKDIDQDLARLLKDEKSAGTLPQTELKLAMGSAAALIKYLGVLHDSSNFGQYQLYQHDLSQFMKLDASALKALNLMPDVVRAYQVVIRLPGFISTLEAVMDEKYRDALDEAYTTKLHEYSDSLAKLAEMVETTVDLEAMDHHEYIIKPEFDEGLKIIRRKLDKLKYEMDQEHRAASKDLGQEIDKKLFLENHKVHGWCMRLTRTEAGCIRNKSKYQECSTQKNGVFFTTSKLQSIRREFDQLSENYNRTQSSLVHEVVSVAASYCPVLESLAAILAHLDVIVSLAHTSVHAPTSYIRPKMHPRGTGSTILKEARHPCMEMQDDVQFITNDVSLIRDTSSFLIITGPNMGGKSTYIRQIGVIALLAQIGCFVPCSEAELTIFDCILARVGASDSQLKGVSTFMAEMLETANILKSATKESLIIIDELGRGTSTYDGFGLAWAISEYIVREIGAFSMFATHFHELTALVEEFPQVKNLHVVAHIDGDAGEKGKREVTLLYKVEEGICDQSFGIHVAELVKFPEKVIGMARRKADELEDFGGAKTGVDAGAGKEYKKEDVEEGSALLKEVLKKWKEEVERNEGWGKEEKMGLLRELVKGDERLLGNAFFKSIEAL